jgi:glutathione S-transferase
MRVYHAPGSRSSRVLWTLEELEVPYEITIVTREDRNSDAHLRRHPLGRVPVIEFDDGGLMFESAAICLQLADLYPEANLIPPLASPERGLVYQWTLFAMTELEGRVFRWLFATRAGEDVTEHISGFTPVGDALRAALAEQEWIVGATFSVADVLIATMLGNAFRRGLLTETGPLRAYVERAQRRPAYLRAEANNA